MSPVCVLHLRGRIANRTSLLRRASLPDSTSDAKLLEALYLLYGAEATALALHGSAAFVLWDEQWRQLIAVRDRMGHHEFFFVVDTAAFALSARVGPLLQRQSSLRLDHRAVAGHLHALPPPAGTSYFQGIASLGAGEMLVVGRETQRTVRYWRPELRTVLRLGSDAEYAEAFWEVFSEVIAEYAPRRAAGITLSGGLDSTSVARALVESGGAERLTALRWISPEVPEADEDFYSSLVRTHLGLDEIPIRADRFWPLRSALSSHLEPESPLVNFYADLWEQTFRSAVAAELGSIFTGYAGDNLLGGNVFAYPDLLLSGRWYQLVRDVLWQSRHSDLSAAQIVRWMVLGPLARRYIPGLRDHMESVAWLDEILRLPYEELRAAEPLPSGTPGRRERLTQLRDPFLPAMNAVFVRHARRHSLELRQPWLDARLIDFALSLPVDQTFRAGIRKGILRRALRGKLPDRVVGLTRKIVPTALFLRGVREREQARVRELITDMRAAAMGFVDERRLQRHYDAFVDSHHDNCMFWYTLTLEAWLRRYFD